MTRCNRNSGAEPDFTAGRMKRLATSALLATVVLIWSCSEPDKQVSRSTADGSFSLVLEGERNWVHPGQSLPIRVTVESLAGPLQEGVFEEVEFVVNNGSVNPTKLTVVMAGIADSLASGPETEYSDWITFKASSSLSSERQGEIHAIFVDALATLKIRIVPTPESL